jgi:uncharacterized membrane protein
MSTPRRSHPGLDAYRGLAVVLMFIVHVRRVQQPAGGEQRVGEALFQFFLWAEPFIAACFLFIAGFSLVLSRAKARDGSAWRAKTLRRAAKLYALSAVLFLPHHGPQFPDMLVSSGILSVIAIAIAGSGLSLVTAHPNRALLGLAASVLGATALLEQLDLSVAGLNAGPGGALPLVGFTAFGALLARLSGHGQSRVLAWAAAVALAPCVAVVISCGPWVTHHYSSYTAYGGEVALRGLLRSVSGPSVQVGFWNHTAVGAIGLLFPLAISLLLFVAAQRSLIRMRVLSPLLLLGRHALAAYVGHLIILGLLELGGITPPNPVSSWLLVGTLTLTACAAAAAWEYSGSRSAGRGPRGPRTPALPDR